MISCVIRHQRQNCINLLIEYNLLSSFDMFKNEHKTKNNIKRTTITKNINCCSLRYRFDTPPSSLVLLFILPVYVSRV